MKSFPVFLFLKVGEINVSFVVDSVTLTGKKVGKKLPNGHRAFTVKIEENILILSPT